MINNETHLLYSVLRFEEGHCRRTQHILKVYALAKLFGEQSQLSAEEQQILRASAILHDIAIKYCKQHCGGNASQQNQKKEAPRLVHDFLTEADYLPAYIPQVTELVLHHHDYSGTTNRMLQLLIEADLIINCYENNPSPEKANSIRKRFQTSAGKELLELCLKNKLEQNNIFITDWRKIDLLEQKMIQFNQNDALRIHHLIKVHHFAQMIGRMEQLDEHTQFITECAAVVHDIGIRPAEEKYESCNGKLQEKEGPAYARNMLEELCFDEADIARICYLVGHHHTYSNIDGIDYQILVESDFLVNFYEDHLKEITIQNTLQNIFQTESGKTLCRTCYLKS